MDLKDLAPWITVAITMALSILVPVFTQICNNRFQLKTNAQMHKHNSEEYEQRKKFEAYENFMKNVGAAIEDGNSEAIRLAGSSIGNLYLYIPKSYYELLDSLFNNIRHYKWEVAEKEYFEIVKRICEFNQTNHQIKIESTKSS